MSRTVIFLGAGASKGLGLPLTNEIFPSIVEQLLDESGQEVLFGGDIAIQERLKRCLSAILPGWNAFASHAQNRRVWRDTLPPITDLLSAIDYLLLSANAPGPDFSRPELALARVLLERAMFELLVRNESPDTLQMEGVPGALHDAWRQTAEARLLPLRPPEYHHELQRTVNWLMELASTLGDRVTLISTNYDIEVEQALYTRLGYDNVFDQVDFGMRVREPDRGTVYRRPADARFGVYKLHGSLNWLRCDVCDNVYLNPLGAIAYLSFLLGDDAVGRPQEQPWLADLRASGADQCHCRYRPLRHMIVAPSFVREVRDPILLEIWHNALEALRQADEWIIVGYSLPPEDVAIRSMFLRAYRGRDTQSHPRVVVVQKEEKEPECTRYRLLLPEHCYETGGLSGYLDSRKGRSA
jgi:hypothetical protein